MNFRRYLLIHTDFYRFSLIPMFLHRCSFIFIDSHPLSIYSYNFSQIFIDVRLFISFWNAEYFIPVLSSLPVVQLHSVLHGQAREMPSCFGEGSRNALLFSKCQVRSNDYRSTRQVDYQLLLTSKQKFCHSIDSIFFIWALSLIISKISQMNVPNFSSKCYKLSQTQLQLSLIS